MIIVPHTPVPEELTAGDVLYVIWPELAGGVAVLLGACIAESGHGVAGAVLVAAGVALLAVFVVRPFLPGFGERRSVARRARRRPVRFDEPFCGADSAVDIDVIVKHR